jgi:O-acetyl-ADP-ribose deacetylase (regulator of RNase III)
MIPQTVQGVKMECVLGNIADQPDMDAVVNAANAELRMGGGVAGAIHRAAGPGLELECRGLAPIRPGQAVITGAHSMPNRYIIHCLGPVFRVDEPGDALLACCYRNALQIARTAAIRSIAFPAISTGAFGYPVEPAARIAFETIIDELPISVGLKHVRFVLFSSADLGVHEAVLEELASAELR